MPGPIPVIVGLGIAGALAYAMGGNAKAATKPATHKPKKKAPTVSATSEAAIIAAMKNPAAIKALIDQVSASGDPIKLWNLGRTMLLNSKTNPTMQAAAAAVLAKAVVMAMKKGDIAGLVANALTNGDAEILAQAALAAASLEPSLAQRLKDLASQLRRSGAPPAPKPSTKPAKSKDDANAQKAAAASTQVIADAIKATAQVEKDPPQAPVPNVPPTPVRPVVTTLPEVIVTAAPPTGPKKAAYQLTSYLESLSAARDHSGRGKEDKKKVGSLQKDMGLGADGVYGPGTAKAIASLGVVPVPPYYWTKSKWQAQKADYKAHIANMARKFTDEDWSQATKNVDRS